MKVVLSIGCGRLHFISSAKWLTKAGVWIRLVCGWVPRGNGFWAKIFPHRTIDIAGVEVCAITSVDFVDQGLRLVNRKLFGGRLHGAVSSLGWRFFGWKSRKYLKGAEIFHCRSGAGQGGAIVRAKELGMKVVVDHSIAHPAFMEKQLREEYEKNGAVFDLGLDSKFWRQIVKDCEDADVVMVNSFFVRDTFVEQGFDEKKIRVVCLGVREDFFGLRVRSAGGDDRSELRELRLLFTGGFGFRKGAEYILEALKILKTRGVAFRMDIVGNYGVARNLIARYGSDLNVAFHGHKPQDELKEYLTKADVYVFPSLAEGCAQSGMEAMAAGDCVIGTKESGLPIVDGENGYLVPGKDAKAIADRIEWLGEHRGEIDRVGANAAMLIAENCTWEKYAENVKKLYDELLWGKEGPR